MDEAVFGCWTAHISTFVTMCGALFTTTAAKLVLSVFAASVQGPFLFLFVGFSHVGLNRGGGPGLLAVSLGPVTKSPTLDETPNQPMD